MKRSPMKPRTAPMDRGTSQLQRTPMSRGDSQLARSATPMASIGARGKRMRQGKISAYANEKAWMDAASQFCIVCWLQRGVRVPAEVHHIKVGDRRVGHLESFGLCPPHHRTGGDSGPFISRHPWKTRFEEAYGSEAYLLAEQRMIVALERIKNW